MMACAALLALILNCLASSDGALSSPLNLSVELLDFKALARWLPGPGNPKGTRYLLEYTDIGNYLESSWNQARDCTNITSSQCYLFLNQRILKEYYVRVRAEWKGELSNWTVLPCSFQPYEYTLLSAPNLTVSADKHSVWIYLSHPVQSLADVRMKFYVDLFQMISDNTTKKHIAHSTTARSYCFRSLPSGNYCVNASAFFTAQFTRNTNATACVFLHLDHREGKFWVVILGVLFLLSIPGVIVLIILYCYVNPIQSGYVPNPLRFRERTGTVQMPNSEDLCTVPFSWLYTDMHQEADGNSSQGYYGGVMRTESEEKIGDDLLLQMEDEADQDMPRTADLYSTAAKMEESDEHSTCSEQSGTYDQYMENAVLDEETSKSSYDFEQTDSSEGDTDSRHSDLNFESNYEPRPDPRYMLEAQFRS